MQEVRKGGAGARVQKIATELQWNRNSDLRKSYGYLRDVLRRVKEVFYDPSHLYLKEEIDAIVEWPAGSSGKMYKPL